MTEDKFDLSRRKVLGSLGVVGAGAALGGAGTAALFNDQDDVTGNTMSAGELDLHVDYKATNPATVPDPSTASGNGDLEGFSLGDIKPGDDGSIKFCVQNVSNPAWIWMQAELTENNDSSSTEPELDEDGEQQNDGSNLWDGELAENIDVTFKYVAPDNESYSDVDIAADTTLYSLLHPTEDTSDNISDGFLLDGDPSSSSTIDHFTENAKVCIVLDWSVNENVGNIIQSDKLKFDVSFYGQQHRHNENKDELTNPFSS